MDKVEFTPRFHRIGSSKKDLTLVVDDPLEKKIQTCKNISKFRKKSNSRSSKSKSRKSSKTYKSEDKNINKYLKAINIKKKFLLRNDFDKKNSKIFLKEKHLMLEKPILFDEI